jgi:hypothetical protein
MHSWRILLLPYLEQQELYEAYDFSEPWNGPKNRLLAERMPKIYALHGEARPGNTTTNYLAVVGSETAWPGPTGLVAEAVTDGKGTTVLLVENRGAGVHWMEPRDLLFRDMDFAVNSPRGVSSTFADPAVLMLDGSLYRLRKDLRPDLLRALMTIRGGEAVTQDQNGGWEWLPDGRQRPLVVP